MRSNHEWKLGGFWKQVNILKRFTHLIMLMYAPHIEAQTITLPSVIIEIKRIIFMRACENMKSFMKCITYFNFMHFIQ